MVKNYCNMELNEYQEKAMSTCMESCENFAYMSYGLVGELGELMGKIAKHIRKGNMVLQDNNLKVTDEFTKEDAEALLAELGDCQWFIAGLAHVLGQDLEDICQANLDKLASRKERGVIDGNGDTR